MITRICLLSLCLALAACSSGQSPPCSPGGANSWPVPAVYGQWASGFGQIQSNNVGTTFAIPPGGGVHYVYTVAPANLKTAQNMTLMFTVSGNGTFGTSDPSDIPPPMVDLFIWQAGDNLSCQGTYVNDRQFSNARVQLQNGTYTLTAPLTQANWHNCYGNGSTVNGVSIDPPNLPQAINNAAYVGFTLGGQYFDGHGVCAYKGTASFTIDSFTVK